MAFTDTAALGNLIQTAYDKFVEFELRSMPVMRMVSDKKPVDQSMPGSSIVFDIYNDLNTATTPLTETVDPTAVAVPDTDEVTVTLVEYGNVVTETRLLRLESFSDVDPAIANIVAYNMVNSIDVVVRDVLRQGTNVTREASGAQTFNTGSAADVTASDFFLSRNVRSGVTKLRGRSAQPRSGLEYVTLIHPDVSYDLRSEAGSSATWRPPHEHSGPANIWAGNIGMYEGSVFIETPRTYQATDGASSAVVHRTIMVGRQALAEAVAEEAHTVFGPVVDQLNRFRPVGWYMVAGWSRYREAAIQRIETSSSLA